MEYKLFLNWDWAYFYPDTTDEIEWLNNVIGQQKIEWDINFSLTGRVQIKFKEEANKQLFILKYGDVVEN